eukprot:459070-Pleurochrysis_carterae.AAC.2
MDPTYAKLLHPEEEEAEEEAEAERVAAEAVADAPDAQGEQLAESAAPADAAAQPTEEGAAPDAAAADGAEAAAPAVEAGEEAAAAPEVAPPAPPKKKKVRQIDPRALVELHVCSPSNVPQAANEGGVMYFIFTGTSPLRLSPGTDVDEAMSAALEHGVHTGGSLVVLEQLISEIYYPLLSTLVSNMKQSGNTDVEAMMDNTEFVSNIQKFGSQITHAIQQVTGDLRLNMPQITIDDPAAAAEDYDIVMQLEGLASHHRPCPLDMRRLYFFMILLQ